MDVDNDGKAGQDDVMVVDGDNGGSWWWTMVKLLTMVTMLMRMVRDLRRQVRFSGWL